MTYDMKDLPYAQFEQIGLTKKEVINMKADDLSNMLSGNRTSLVPLTIPLGEGMQPLQTEAKLSLSRNPDNTLSLGIHPILAKATNTIDATPQQWEQMLKGEPIVKDTRAYNGQMEPHIHQLDKDTKEVLSARVANIQIPNIINDQSITNEQKETLKRGQAIELEGSGNQKAVSVKLDLNEPKGYAMQQAEQKVALQPEQQEPQREAARAVVEAPSINQAGQALRAPTYDQATEQQRMPSLDHPIRYVEVAMNNVAQNQDKMQSMRQDFERAGASVTTLEPSRTLGGPEQLRMMVGYRTDQPELAAIQGKMLDVQREAQQTQTIQFKERAGQGMERSSAVERQQREPAQTVVEASSIQAGQKLDNKESTAFILHMAPKNEPTKLDAFVTESKDQIYDRFRLYEKSHDLKVEAFPGVKAEAIQPKLDEYSGKGAVVLANSEAWKGAEVKDPGLKAVFERKDAHSGRETAEFGVSAPKAVATVAPEVSSEPSRGFKR